MTDKTQTLHVAMAAAFGAIEGATKSVTGQVGQQKYMYADIGSVIAAIKPALIANGLFFTQHPQPSEGGVTVETMLHHTSGASMSLGALFVPAKNKDAQAFGSALTYARRYALVTAFGVPVEDDDGNAAVKPPPPAPPPVPPASVELFLTGLRNSYDDGTTADYWTTNWPGIEKEWRPYVLEQKEQIKAAQGNVANMRAG